MFAFVLIGIIVHAFVLLAIFMICGIILGVIGDAIENKPTKPYEAYNHLHDRHHAGHDV
jgi:hypothetical protein